MRRGAADRFRRWFEYEKDSHAKVLASLDSVPTQLRSSPSFQKAVDLMAHIVAARWLWLSRLGAATQGPRELFPEGAALPDLPDRVREMQEAWSAYLRRLDDVELARAFEYRSTEGEWYRNTVEDTLAQLFGHSWYHRGQIASLIRSIGAEPAVTDFVFWTREPVPPRDESRSPPTPPPDRRRTLERRLLPDRRRGLDRRAGERRRPGAPVESERRLEINRRQGGERRSGSDRRTSVGELLRNVLRLLADVADSGSLNDEVRRDLDGAVFRLRFALDTLEGGDVE